MKKTKVARGVRKTPSRKRDAARRRSSIFRKRSEAAKKGWETRRKNEKARRRKVKVPQVTKGPGRPKPSRRKPLPIEGGAKLLPAGSELELSARARTDGNGKMTRSRLLYMKVRVVLLRAMTKRDAITALHRTVARGIVQDGIMLGWIDWKKGVGHTGVHGQYLGVRALAALVDFVGAIMSSPQRRIAVIAPGDVG